jgi:hypothetical protein
MPEGGGYLLLSEADTYARGRLAAGLADHVWSMGELLEKVIPHGTEAMAS